MISTCGNYEIIDRCFPPNFGSHVIIETKDSLVVLPAKYYQHVNKSFKVYSCNLKSVTSLRTDGKPLTQTTLDIIGEITNCFSEASDLFSLMWSSKVMYSFITSPEIFGCKNVEFEETVSTESGFLNYPSQKTYPFISPIQPNYFINNLIYKDRDDSLFLFIIPQLNRLKKIHLKIGEEANVYTSNINFSRPYINLYPSLINLTHLEFSFSSTAEKYPGGVFNLLVKCPNITTLKVMEKHFPYSKRKVVVDSLNNIFENFDFNNVKKLTTLDVTTQMETFTYYLNKLSNLKKLKLKKPPEVLFDPFPLNQPPLSNNLYKLAFLSLWGFNFDEEITAAFELLINLKHLQIRKCRLITNEMFFNLKSLVSLNFDELSVSHKLSEKAFTNLSKLKYLRLTASEAKFRFQLTQKILQKLPQLEVVSLSALFYGLKEEEWTPIRGQYKYECHPILWKLFQQIKQLKQLTALAIVNSSLDQSKFMKNFFKETEIELYSDFSRYTFKSKELSEIMHWYPTLYEHVDRQNIETLKYNLL